MALKHEVKKGDGENVKLIKQKKTGVKTPKKEIYSLDIIVLKVKVLYLIT